MMDLRNFPPPVEGVRLEQNNTQAHVHNQSLGNGKLFIVESQVVWLNENGRGFSLQYPAISLHAVSRDLSAFPHECLYLMVDGILGGEEEDEGNGSGDEESEYKITEVRFIPQDKTALDSMFQAMSECQTLHPDPEDSFSEEEEEEERVMFTGEGDIGNLTAEGQARLQHLESIFQEGMEISDEPQIGRAALQNGHAGGDDGSKNVDMETGQFEDAPE